MPRWARQSPEAAAEWMLELEPGPTQQNAAEHFVSTAASHEPELAFAWALAIENETKQREALETAASHWLKANDQQAHGAINESGLPQDLVNDLLKADQ